MEMTKKELLPIQAKADRAFRRYERLAIDHAEPTSCYTAHDVETARQVWKLADDEYQDAKAEYEAA